MCFECKAIHYIIHLFYIQCRDRDNFVCPLLSACYRLTVLASKVGAPEVVNRDRDL